MCISLKLTIMSPIINSPSINVNTDKTFFGRLFVGKMYFGIKRTHFLGRRTRSCPTVSDKVYYIPGQLIKGDNVARVELKNY
ncbi:hypothetical protein KN1_11160 [Stygiolobus caldivivus]|uniref:Uncharacterized protein n=1 Tax=Stygiolobus caldivivus TaxID=2824673 RepID=A0A8D5U6N4_9CREN|nr:hypothetical protein KN1_11160 [Stygiolobus caldivivus]